MTHQKRFWKAFFLTAIIVICMFYATFLIGVESMFGAAIGTSPLLIAVFYYGFGWTAREEKNELRAIQTEGQLHEMQEQLAALKAQNAQLLSLLDASPNPEPPEPDAGTAPETPAPDQPQP